MRIFPKGMKSLPRPEKRQIMRAVQKGRRVDDPAQAGMAVEYAAHYARQCSVVVVLFSISAALNLLGLALGFSWFRAVSSVFWLASVAWWLYLRGRVRRSLVLNQALLSGGTGTH